MDMLLATPQRIQIMTPMVSMNTVILQKMIGILKKIAAIMLI